MKKKVSEMKKISVMIPCYNEEENVVPMSEAIVSLFETELMNFYLLTIIRRTARVLF